MDTQIIKKDEYASYITTTHGLAGYFAVMIWWNNTGEEGLPGFWEPYETGIGRYATREEAIAEAKLWALNENLEYRDQ